MCLGIPGRILSLVPATIGPGPTATVDFQGTRVEVSLALVPAARVGDWVLVHAGLALEVLDADEVRETWRWLREAELVVGDPDPVVG
jgi:hydrogenase expression/formation protein HypC